VSNGLDINVRRNRLGSKARLQYSPLGCVSGIRMPGCCLSHALLFSCCKRGTSDIVHRAHGCNNSRLHHLAKVFEAPSSHRTSKTRKRYSKTPCVIMAAFSVKTPPSARWTDCASRYFHYNTPWNLGSRKERQGELARIWLPGPLRVDQANEH
jgi:hypothetical protein